MTAQITQDQQYIAFVRNHATALLLQAEAGVDAQKEWNGQYGGIGRLDTEAFQGEDAGLAKADIENALGVLSTLNTWLDEAGQNRRTYLLRICFQSGNGG